MNQGVRVPSAHCLDKFIHVGKVLLPLRLRLGGPKIQRVFSQLGIVRPQVQGHRDNAGGIEASPSNIQVHFPNANPSTVHPQISETQHTRAIGHDDEVHLRYRVVVYHRSHLTLVLHAEIHLLVPACHPQLAPVEADIPDSRCIHNGGHGLEVFHQGQVVQHSIEVLQSLQQLPLVQRRGVSLLHLLGDFLVLTDKQIVLLLEVIESRRQKAPQTQSLALRWGESNPLVVQSVLKEGGPLAEHPQRPPTLVPGHPRRGHRRHMHRLILHLRPVHLHAPTALVLHLLQHVPHHGLRIHH
mmetsp:Transcript_3914/g.8708  ORF Transcript_3914/g.8708 Transcript_3914/m.8708 type:complete len:298 (-) Transcript_3914:98-991(-)